MGFQDHTRNIFSDGLDRSGGNWTIGFAINYGEGNDPEPPGEHGIPLLLNLLPVPKKGGEIKAEAERAVSPRGSMVEKYL